MNFQQCLFYLNQVQKLGIKFGLNNVKTILAAFQDPHKQFPAVVVAGSNGKGSVCAMLVRILSLHGYKTGLYSSPHLARYEERIRVSERLIPQRDFSLCLTKLKDKIDELIAADILSSPPTHFELMSCLALLYFCEQKVDMAVLEVGMGGRFDATNAVTPKVSVITTISLEHQAYLGETLSQIAFEKAGIIKPGVPVVCGSRSEEATATIRKRARESGSEYFGVFDKKDCFRKTKRRDKYTFTYEMNGDLYEFSPSLQGEHQGDNAAVVIAAVHHLSRCWKKLEKKKTVQALESTQWEGRLEIFSQKPLILLDGAHNEQGMKALRAYLLDFVSSPITLVFAAMRDKKIGELADILFPVVDKIILTSFPYHRAASPAEIKAKASRYRHRITMEPNANKALHLAVKAAGDKSAIVVAGSLFLVGEIKKGKKPLSSSAM